MPAYFDRGKAFFLKKDYERAIEDWEVVINQFDERNLMTLDFLGLASTHLRNEAKAARYFEEAVRLDERLTYAPAHAHLGALRYNQRVYDDAIKECTKAIEIDRMLVDAYSTRSLAYKATKQIDKAKADEREVAKLRGAARDGQRPAERRQ